MEENKDFHSAEQNEALKQENSSGMSDTDVGEELFSKKLNSQ